MILVYALISTGITCGMILYLVDLYSRVTLYRIVEEKIKELEKLIEESKDD